MKGLRHVEIFATLLKFSTNQDVQNYARTYVLHLDSGVFFYKYGCCRCQYCHHIIVDILGIDSYYINKLHTVTDLMDGRRCLF